MLNPLARSSAPNDPGYPSTIRTAPHLDEQAGLGAYLQDVLTVPASLAGLPALSVPIAVGEEGGGWPLGMSIVGKWGCEAMTLAVEAVIEDAEREAR